MVSGFCLGDDITIIIVFMILIRCSDIPSVPVSKLPQLVYETKQDLESLGLVSTIVGHVGDGNFHALLLFSSDEELAIARGAVHRMVERAIRLDGTCTGEHGVGIGKKEYLVEELGAGTVELMKTVKRAIDPLGLFNPGKVGRFSLWFLECGADLSI